MLRGGGAKYTEKLNQSKNVGGWDTGYSYVVTVDGVFDEVGIVKYSLMTETVLVTGEV